MKLLLFFILFFSFNLNSNVYTKTDVFVDAFNLNKKNTLKALIPKNTKLSVKEIKNKRWYEVFENKKSLGYVENDCVKTSFREILFYKNCELKSEPDESFASIKTIKKGTKFTEFKIKDTNYYKVKYKNKFVWLKENKLKLIIIPEINSKELTSVAFKDFLKHKRIKTKVSPFLDKTVYVTTDKGIFLSYDSKKWFKIKRFKSKNHVLEIDKKGYLYIDNYISMDYGKTFKEIFPSYAFPYKNTFIRSLMISPQDKDSIYLTFASKEDQDNITMFVLDKDKKVWKKVYPSVDGKKYVTVPAEDSSISVLKFLNEKWIKKINNADHLQNLSVYNSDDGKIKTRMLINNKKEKTKHEVTMVLGYDISKGLKVIKEIWRVI
jgi:uncharacterized protein YgiM (DUF1202 family)